MLQELKRYFSRTKAPEQKDAPDAYNIWAPEYDQQPDNLMLYLDEKVFGSLLAPIALTGKTVIDIGCGTGRHWKMLLQQQPAALIGYDVSDGMLSELRKKFPGAAVQLATDNRLSGVSDQSADVILSTLTVAHIENFREALTAWVRVLKKSGDMIITDFHPDILDRGGKRDFKARGQQIIIRNHVHPLPLLQTISSQLGMRTMKLVEMPIDETVRHFYEKQGALAVYEKYKGMPVIYGLHLKKP